MTLQICRSRDLGIENWSDIRVFLSVMRLGSTLAAAKELGVTQTTVARRIDALEHVLRLTLFHRDTRGFHPTPEAEALKASAKSMEDAAGALVLDAQRLLDNKSQTIRITTSHEAYIYIIAGIAAEFMKANPGTRIENVTTDARLDIDKGEADIAFRNAPTPGGSKSTVRKIGVETWSVFCSAAYAAEHGIPRTEDALFHHRTVLFGGTFVQGPMTVWMREQVDPHKVVAQCEAVGPVLSLLNADMGIGPMVTSIAMSQTPPLVHCMDSPVNAAVPTWLVVSPEAQRNKVIRRFADYAAQRYREIYLERFGISPLP